MLVYGRKRWFAVPPRFEVTARQDVAAWAEDGRGKLVQQGVVVSVEVVIISDGQRH